MGGAESAGNITGECVNNEKKENKMNKKGESDNMAHTNINKTAFLYNYTFSI